MKLSILALLLLTGCAPKKHRIPETPGIRKYTGCREISVNIKTDEITFVCPAHREVKK
jgi:hypothetical protein